MAKKPAFLVTQPTPTKTLADMTIGELGYTTPNAYIVEDDVPAQAKNYFVEDTLPVSPVKDGNMDVKVRRVQQGYELDFSESEAVGV